MAKQKALMVCSIFSCVVIIFAKFRINRPAPLKIFFAGDVLGRSQAGPSTSAALSPPHFPRLGPSTSVYADDDSDSGSENEESMLDSSSFIPATPPRKKVGELPTSKKLVEIFVIHCLSPCLFSLNSPIVVQVHVLWV